MAMRLKCTMATEHQEQAAFMSWLAKFHPKVYELTYHVPNGRLSAAEGSKYKRIGAKSGVPDVCIALPVEPYHGLYIEFKRRDGGSGLSETQSTWITKLSCVGYRAVMAKGWEEAKRIVEKYIGGNKS